MKNEKKVILKDRIIQIFFPYDPDLVAKVRNLPGRKFHSNSPKHWTCPLSQESAEKLKSWEFHLSEDLYKFIEQKQERKTITEQEKIEISGLKMNLYPFQKQGVAFLESQNGRALIADEMGLGKTAQALAWLQLHPESRPVIVVVPASLKLNWEREANIWMPNPQTQILSGKNGNDVLWGKIIIINYDILPHWIEKLKAIKAQVLVTDECHYYKNNKAKRTKAIKALAKGVPYVIALSGTPIVNKPIEGFNAINIIDPTIVPSFWQYAHRYCGAKWNGYGWDFNGATNTGELHEKLTKAIMIRRKKEDVLLDLPDKNRIFLPIEIDNAKEYCKVKNNFLQWVEEKRGENAASKASNAETLAQIEALKQVAVKGKLSQAISWIQDFLEVDGKLIVFAIHKFTIEALMAEFKNVAVKIDGSVSQSDRDKAVQKFQTDKNVRLFIGNIKAAGVGLTLTAASNIAFLELPWTSGELVQAEDRCHRIGQKNAVSIYYLLADSTIEEDIAKLIDKKRKVLDQVLDGKTTKEESLLSELMKKFKEE